MSDLLTVIFLAHASDTELQLQVCKCKPLMHSKACPPVAVMQTAVAGARMQDKGRACGKKRTTHTRTPREFIFALGHKPPPDKALELLSVVTREPKIYIQQYSTEIIKMN